MEYLIHYLTFPDILWFILVSAGVLALMQCILKAYVKVRYKDLRNGPGDWPPADPEGGSRVDVFDRFNEMYAQLLFSSTSILLFVGVYFLIDFHYFPLPDSFYAAWSRYDVLILLGVLVVAILLIDLLERFVVPVKLMPDDMRRTLRLAAMIYMMVIFIYIKFIYEDDNYDSMIFYCVSMLIGRFVYFDVSFRDVVSIWKSLVYVLPILLMVLGTTALLALYGFGSGYLLRGNGVVVSLWIAHLFVIIELMVLMRVRKKFRRGRRMKDLQHRYMDPPEET